MHLCLNYRPDTSHQLIVFLIKQRAVNFCFDSFQLVQNPQLVDILRFTFFLLFDHSFSFCLTKTHATNLITTVQFTFIFTTSWTTFISIIFIEPSFLFFACTWLDYLWFNWFLVTVKSSFGFHFTFLFLSLFSFLFLFLSLFALNCMINFNFVDRLNHFWLKMRLSCFSFYHHLLLFNCFLFK